MQAVIYLAAKAENAPTLQRTISEDLDIPNHFLGKILQQLTPHHIIRSQKGKDGGFSLDQPPAEISLYSIIEIIDGESVLDKCILGFPGCADNSPCPLHNQWSAAKDSIILMLKTETIADLAKRMDVKLDQIKTTITQSLKNNA